MIKTQIFARKTRVLAPCEEVFAWHARPGALERLTPPWEPVEVLDKSGDRVVLKTRIGPFNKRWVAEHTDWKDGEMFRDVQIEGPFAKWEHTHRFTPAGDTACDMEDHIEYALPAGGVGQALGGSMVRGKLDRMFQYRHDTLVRDLEAHSKLTKPLRIAVTGSNGLVGSVLIPFLTTGGHDVKRVLRGDFDQFGETDVVVHLAGESIAEGRWNPAKKERIRKSRVEGTRKVIERAVAVGAKVVVCASAIGYYGDRGDAIVHETSEPGEGFLADVCREWEAAAQAAGIRVVNLRFGVILSPKGGALAKMLTPFKLGAGGRIGSGKQYMSWISIDDAVGVIHHAIGDESLRGPVNAVAPQAVTNREFTKTLGRVLKRPTIFPMPAFVARAAFGEMANELLLASTRVRPAVLDASSYTFRDPSLEPALRRLLGR